MFLGFIDSWFSHTIHCIDHCIVITMLNFFATPEFMFPIFNRRHLNDMSLISPRLTSFLRAFRTTSIWQVNLFLLFSLFNYIYIYNFYLIVDVIGVVREWGLLEKQVGRVQSCNPEMRQIVIFDARYLILNTYSTTFMWNCSLTVRP